MRSYPLPFLSLFVRESFENPKHDNTWREMRSGGMDDRQVGVCGHVEEQKFRSFRFESILCWIMFG